jgi:putative DNA primase/helicase
LPFKAFGKPTLISTKGYALMDKLPLKIPFDAIAQTLLASAERWCSQWLPGGKRHGHEYQAAKTSQGGMGDSLSVNLNTGVWSHFASGDGGADLISLFAYIEGKTQGDAAKDLMAQLGMTMDAPTQAPTPPKPIDKPAKDTWTPIQPVPDYAPKTNFNHWQYSNPQHIATYQRGAELYGYVVRFIKSDGDKITLPHVWAKSQKGEMKWTWKAFAEPRPLYLPAGERPDATVVVVEGERKADVLQALLDASAPKTYQVTGWPGGCKAWALADWSWLAGRTVLLWPDSDSQRVTVPRADLAACNTDAEREALQLAQPFKPAIEQPGIQAMLAIGGRLQEHGCTVQLLPAFAPGDKPDGWDCADAIETDGWDFAAIQTFFGKAAGLGHGPASASMQGGTPDWLAPYLTNTGKWLVSRKLVIKALECDPVLVNVLGLDQMSNNIVARSDWPWFNGKAGPITGTVDLMLGSYLSSTYGLPSIPRQALGEAIETVAHQNQFHPLREWLQGLKHDGKSRIDKWLVHALGETPESLKDQSGLFEYLSLVGRYWLLGMVNRVMVPGCKFDYCPVLEGPGGLGKSTIVEVLASSAYFSDTIFDVQRGKEGQEQVQGLWMYEIAEMGNFNKSEVGLIKAFITAKVDRYRPSYGRTVESYPRQCVLVATTNERSYLRDRTGNRRFWPIPVRNRINNPWVQAMREQLFAEAYAMFLQGEAYTPTPDVEARLFAPVQETRMVDTAVQSDLYRVLTRHAGLSGIESEVHKDAAFVTISQVVSALGTDVAKSTPALEAQIRGWMDQEGWVRKRQATGTRQYGWERPAKWPKTISTDAPTALPSEAGRSPINQFMQELDDVPF